MSSPHSGQVTDKTVAVGQCPGCGIVTGDEVDFRFPRVSLCNNCGSALKSATIADESEVKELAG